MKFLTSFANKLLGRNKPADREAPAPSTDVEQVPTERKESSNGVIHQDEHNIDRRKLDRNANAVVYGLTDAGHKAYLVGGCIRDLLMGLRPKDFDVATSAHPEEAASLLKRARLIGRRFKLVHVRFGRDIIEVATFRAGHDQADSPQGDQGKQAESGLILRDNVYGTIEEDALRRDFTVNALYYDLADHSIRDFANGYQDLKDKVIRMIGDPADRYREDPVRMLRAARFAAKLDFAIEPATAAPIKELAPLLRNIAPARIFDESLKLFQSGHAESVYELMQQHDLFTQLFPQTAHCINSCQDYPVEVLIKNALGNTDRRIRQRKSVTPAFLYAALLWYPLQVRLNALQQKQPNEPATQLLHEAANQIISEQVKSTAIPRRFSTPVREIWEMQLRLPRNHGKRAERLMEHPRFRAAYDLLLLRENSGEDLGGLSQWWTDYQATHKPPQQQHEYSRDSHNDDKPKRRRRRRRPQGNNSQANSSNHNG